MQILNLVSQIFKLIITVSNVPVGIDRIGHLNHICCHYLNSFQQLRNVLDLWSVACPIIKLVVNT